MADPAIVRAVAQAVAARLGGAADDETLRLVVREVVGVLGSESSDSRAPRSQMSTPAGSAQAATTTPAGSGRLEDNGDGTVTTGLGARLPRPGSRGIPPELCIGCVEQTRRGRRNRAVVTASGLNRLGIVARLTSCIAELGGSIEDISQTIVSDYFTTIFLVDLREATEPFAVLKKKTEAVAEQLGIHVVLMHEDVMRALQRV